MDKELFPDDTVAGEAGGLRPKGQIAPTRSEQPRRFTREFIERINQNTKRSMEGS